MIKTKKTLHTLFFSVCLMGVSHSAFAEDQDKSSQKSGSMLAKAVHITVAVAHAPLAIASVYKPDSKLLPVLSALSRVTANWLYWHRHPNDGHFYTSELIAEGIVDCIVHCCASDKKQDIGNLDDLLDDVPKTQQSFDSQKEIEKSENELTGDGSGNIEDGSTSSSEGMSKQDIVSMLVKIGKIGLPIIESGLSLGVALHDDDSRVPRALREVLQGINVLSRGTSQLLTLDNKKLKWAIAGLMVINAFMLYKDIKTYKKAPELEKREERIRERLNQLRERRDNMNLNLPLNVRYNIDNIIRQSERTLRNGDCSEYDFDRLERNLGRIENNITRIERENEDRVRELEARIERDRERAEEMLRELEAENHNPEPEHERPAREFRRQAGACPVCLDADADNDPLETIELACGHLCCRNCAGRMVDVAYRNRRIDFDRIGCPNGGCDGHISRVEIGVISNNNQDMLRAYDEARRERLHPVRVELDDEMREMVRRGDVRICPGCRNGVHRIAGCNHMTCRCRVEFCYRCNARYVRRHGFLQHPEPQCPIFDDLARPDLNAPIIIE